jgi:hypothetical protein
MMKNKTRAVAAVFAALLALTGTAVVTASPAAAEKQWCC